MAVNKLRGDEAVQGLSDHRLHDFWAWAFSDMLANTTRAVFAEYLVAAALGLEDAVRVEWDAVDLRYEGKAIEVKASAYVQSWPQEQHSDIRYDIARKLPWDAPTNSYGDKRTRSADCYVFFLFGETDFELARERVLNAAYWRFYVVSTSVINEQLGEQKSVGLARIKMMATECGFEGLRTTIRRVLSLDQDG